MPLCLLVCLCVCVDFANDDGRHIHLTHPIELHSLCAVIESILFHGKNVKRNRRMRGRGTIYIWKMIICMSTREFIFNEFNASIWLFLSDLNICSLLISYVEHASHTQTLTHTHTHMLAQSTRIPHQLRFCIFIISKYFSIQLCARGV